MSKIHKLEQGSDEWKEYRKNYFNASEAPAMMGVSSYKTRDELLAEKATGVIPEFSDGTLRIFEAGHKAEAYAMKNYVKNYIDEDLFNPTMSEDIDGLKLSASFDGLTMMDDIAFEHKMLNKKLGESLSVGIIPDEYIPQLEQQLLVSGAGKVLFMASDDKSEYSVWYKSDPKFRKKLIAGWKQFSKDLKKWTPTAVESRVEAVSIEDMPSLSIKLTGGVKSSNMDEYESSALAFISNIKTNLENDEDFANAEAVVKFCGKTEKELDAVKKKALEQTADINQLFSIIDNLKAEMRSKRLELDKSVKERKSAIKAAIATKAHGEYANFISELDAGFGNSGIHVESISLNLEAAMKNKRTIKSLQNAVNTELAECKIKMSEMADSMLGNFNALKDIAGEYGFLFSDIQSIVTKEREDLLNLAKQRISEYKEEEERKLEAERERIRLEEEAKANSQEEVDVVDDVKETEAKEVVKSTTDTKKEELCDDSPDYDYFNRQIKIILSNLENYTKDELRLAFTRLSNAV